MSLFHDPNLLSPEFISSLTDTELKDAVNNTKATLEVVGGSTSEWFVRKNLENLMLEVQRRNLVIIGSTKGAIAIPFKPIYIYVGVALLTLGIGTFIILRKKKQGVK